jgi:hypothetical protein
VPETGEAGVNESGDVVEQDYAAEIAKREAGLKKLKAQMDKIAQRFINATGAFLADSYRTTTLEIIQQEKHITMRMDNAALRSIKQQVETLTARAPEIAFQHLDKPEVWWHRDENLGGRRIIDGVYAAPERYKEGTLGDSLRYAMGELARVLEPPGFLRMPHDQARFAWRNFGEPESRGEKGPPYFREEKWELSAPMLTALQSYREHYQQALKVKQEVAELEYQKGRADVRGRWEEL